MEESVTYEHLFNLGNFNHEKYVITASVPVNSSHAERLRDAAIVVTHLQEEVDNYRRLRMKRAGLVDRLRWHENSEPSAQEELKGRLADLDKRIGAFETKHKPTCVACKCYYCQGGGDDD